MNRLRTILSLPILLGMFSIVHASADDLTHFVDTRQGTDSDFGLSRGNTYPATGMPFGMHLWSPQTGLNGDGWKYQWKADSLRGLSQSHQCSPWVGDYAVYSLMPVTGRLRTDERARAAAFTHDNETALPHYYRVRLNDGTIAEVAPTTRGAHFRFSYPRGQQAWLVLDGYHGQFDMKVDAARRQIVGWVNNHRFVNHPETFRCYFILQFDKPFTSQGKWAEGVYVGFAPGTKVQVKAASSYISAEQARLTLQTELGSDRSLNQTRERGRKTWNQLLGQVRVQGGTEEQLRTFYSCLFRANLFSRKFYERRSDGTSYYYSPYDGRVHDGYMYTDNGFWDTFRSQFPLTCLLHPTQQGRYMEALLQAQHECGWLPSWSFPGETGGMVGNHAISLLADAWAKGIRTVSADSILKAYAHEAMNKGPWGGANGRAGWKSYFTLGYVPFPESHGSVTQTLEYAYDDFCAWQLARSAGLKHWERVFGRQMMNYRNLWDSETHFMRGRSSDGRWTEPFDPLEWGGPYTEGNAWHYIWSVFHDVQGLINLFGSDQAFVEKIDSVFTMENTVKPGWYGGIIHEMKEMQLADMGQYAHGNQPIQHLPYLYTYAGQPWKTQYWVRQIMNRLYNSGPQGFPGDEDQGGMSAWYVLSAMGLYAVTPGTDQYVIGSPLFNSMTLTTEEGRHFTIEAQNNSAENVYIESATLNGQPFGRNYLTYDEINRGGTLVLQMSSEPNRQRAISKQAAPFSLSRARASRR
ncbi:GH92 family glycosyl hydrolase [Prevotella sp. E13-17]|uniref:GH92 family glycosyl hydrolase n=1 Tax=Prevotella sp. E13-17 TaxID=2913616 RepID=UPI001ED9FBBC|nr:GH92 family glycosyl hydrolase [Prevotella sp. E13-17]UKK51051.1 GH92 family glycosyl hydrolase [Prevotella sp. E13-17]